MTLNHVHLGSAHSPETQAFYEKFFGFRVESQHGHSVFMRDAAGFLLVVEPEAASHQFPPSFHLGFCQPREHVVHELHSRFKAAGVPIARELLAEEGEYASFYVQDPDGVTIEVSWHAR